MPLVGQLAGGPGSRPFFGR